MEHWSLTTLREKAFARFTLDCVPYLGCNGGQVVLNITFAPLPAEEADTSVQGLIDFVVVQNFSPGTEAGLLNKLKAAKRKIEQDKTDEAIDKLNEFTVVVTEKQNEGLIDDAVAESMIFAAGEIITSLQPA